MAYRASNATYRRNLYADARQYGARAVRLFFLLQSGCCEEPMRTLVWSFLRADLGRAMSAAKRYLKKGGRVPVRDRKSKMEREAQAAELTQRFSTSTSVELTERVIAGALVEKPLSPRVRSQVKPKLPERIPAREAAQERQAASRGSEIVKPRPPRAVHRSGARHTQAAGLNVAEARDGVGLMLSGARLLRALARRQ
jgi:hypothetical protein